MSNLISSGPSRRGHPCEHCGKSFNSSHQLAQHSRVHTGEKPYKCSYCDRKFKQLSHVQQHTRLHTGERPYKCAAPNCGRSFIQLSNLQQHMKTHSPIDKIVKESDKSFFCNHCGKGFKCESSLMSHETKKHSDQLSSIELFLSKDSRNLVQFTCHLCGKVLSNENAYKKHIQTHQCINVSSPASSASPPDIQLWTCDKCPSVFSNEFALLSHMDDMRSDPKHLFEPKVMLNCVNKEENTQNMNSLANSLLENSDSSSHSNSSISANMLAQSILQMNQNSIMEDSSLSQESNNRTD